LTEKEIIMTFTSFVVLEIAVGLATIALAIYRKFLAMREETLIHLGPGEEKNIPKQVNVARRLRYIDRWGETLTVLTAAGGILLAAAYLAQIWALSLRPY
jgi:hypothetical protein